MLEHHPAVKAYSPQAVPADNFLGDDYFHRGAFRLGAMFGFLPAMETSKAFTDFPFEQLDLYSWFLGLGALSQQFPVARARLAHRRHSLHIEAFQLRVV